MGRLVIAHHKSYHPYKAENIERVRRDEEEARLKEAKEEGRLRLADSEARLELLRKRAGISASSSKESRKDEDLIPDAVKESLKEHQTKEMSDSSLQSLMTDGHINLFADLENREASLKQATDRSRKPKGKKDSDEDDAETDKGYRLAPSKADRTPWYTKSKEEGQPKLDPAKRDRDEIRKQKHDPLKEIEASLSRASSSSRISPPRVSSKNPMGPPSIPKPSSSNSMLDNRLSREISERQRAAELIARKRKERMGNETPTTVAPSEDGYGNMYNKDDVEAAARRRREGDSNRWKERVRHWDGTSGAGKRW
ncbi:hypothetical protein CPB86DRAFT_777974 [Serendipita vermifera]|nr:hypothetical protein CPB86DRAFT_777974 [Serendipita vermifera]